MTCATARRRRAHPTSLLALRRRLRCACLNEDHERDLFERASSLTVDHLIERRAERAHEQEALAGFLWTLAQAAMAPRDDVHARAARAVARAAALHLVTARLRDETDELMRRLIVQRNQRLAS